MPRVERIKRRLLEEAVRQNLELRQGRLPGPVRRSRRRIRTLVRTSLIVLLPAGFFATSYMLWALVQESVASISVPIDPVDPARGRRVSRPPVPRPEPRFDAPPAVDRGVFPLGVQKIVLDPGHGGANSGTVTPQGLQEKELTLDIGQRLRVLLEEASFEVAMTRRTDVAVSLEERVAFANQNAGDIFVSIHVNWIETKNVRGVETYYLGPTDDPYLNQLASSENRNSGYSLADFRRLLEGIYVGVRQDESRKLAKAVQSSLFRSLRDVNRQVQNRGVKTAPFVVLVGTEMPAILAEVSCLSNEEEAGLLQKPRYRQYIAEALSSGVRAYADALNRPLAKGSS